MWEQRKDKSGFNQNQESGTEIIGICKEIIIMTMEFCLKKIKQNSYFCKLK